MKLRINQDLHLIYLTFSDKFQKGTDNSKKRGTDWGKRGGSEIFREAGF